MSHSVFLNSKDMNESEREGHAPFFETPISTLEARGSQSECEIGGLFLLPLLGAHEGRSCMRK